MMTPEQRRLFGQYILDCEARRDRQKHLTVYSLPAGDGGGRFEVAGICERYDHDVAYHLADLIKAGKFDEAEHEARDYYLSNTDAVKDWHPMPAIEAFLRDTTFHRGVKGCAKIVQMATGQTNDGVFGPKTRRALADLVLIDPQQALTKLRLACEAYERIVAPPIGARAKFWNGLVNRWDKRTAFARGWLAA